MRALFFALIVLLVPHVAAAQEESPLNLRNAGGASCAEFTRIFASEGNPLEKTAYLQWTAGYATGVARSNNVIDVFPLQDTMHLVQMVILVCGENPEAFLERALLQTLIRLRPYWVTGSANMLTLTVNGNETRFAEAAVRPLQQTLAGLGAEITVDGIYGNQTGAAISAISNNAGLGPVVVPTGALFYLLTRPPA